MCILRGVSSCCSTDSTRPPQRTLAGLAEVLRDENWGQCRIILASRPYALEFHWLQLFRHADRAPGWRFFLQLDEFTEPQQKKYLGRETVRGACRPMPARS